MLLVLCYGGVVDNLHIDVLATTVNGEAWEAVLEGDERVTHAHPSSQPTLLSAFDL